MVIKIGACHICAGDMQRELDNRPDLFPERKVKNGKYTWTIHIASNPRTADPKSLFMMAWRKVPDTNIFTYHQTKVVGNTICCSNY
ncbi:hypothetical protein VTH82DRAFT_1237 [Thermothelomyces myriococcoides]